MKLKTEVKGLEVLITVPVPTARQLSRSESTGAISIDWDVVIDEKTGEPVRIRGVKASLDRRR